MLFGSATKSAPQRRLLIGTYGLDPGNLQPFGAECFVRNHKDKPRKFERRSSPAKLVGYAPHGLGYRVWIPGTQTVLKSKDVVFLKKPLLQNTTEEDSEENNETVDQENNESKQPNQEEEEAPEPERPNSPNMDSPGIELRSRTGLRKPKRFDDEIYVSETTEAFLVRKRSKAHSVDSGGER